MKNKNVYCTLRKRTLRADERIRKRISPKRSGKEKGWEEIKKKLINGTPKGTILIRAFSIPLAFMLRTLHYSLISLFALFASVYFQYYFFPLLSVPLSRLFHTSLEFMSPDG